MRERELEGEREKWPTSLMRKPVQIPTDTACPISIPVTYIRREHSPQSLTGRAEGLSLPNVETGGVGCKIPWFMWGLTQYLGLKEDH